MSNGVPVTIVGAGAAGAAIARELVRRGYSVRLLYRGATEGSSFTNQKWQHSGLLYPDRALAREAWQNYRESYPAIEQFVLKHQAGARLLAINEATLTERAAWWRAWEVADWGLEWARLNPEEYSEFPDVRGGLPPLPK